MKYRFFQIMRFFIRHIYNERYPIITSLYGFIALKTQDYSVGHKPSFIYCWVLYHLGMEFASTRSKAMVKAGEWLVHRVPGDMRFELA